MTITIREQVLAALRNNPGLNSVKLAGLIGMDTKKISGTVSTLLADGLISCEGKYGQRLYSLTSYGMRFAPDTIPGVKQGKSKLIQRTDTNVISQECRNSAAMKRVLMVWGEGRGMSEWSDYRLMVRTMAKGNGVTLISIAKHCGVSHRKLNQILQAGPSKEQEELIAEALGCAGCDLAEIHRQMGELSDKYGRAGV